MFCIKFVSIQVSWNGSPLDVFFPSRGIRQGDLMSPYIFVLCIERLGLAIRKNMESGAIKLVRISANGPDIPYLFFTDDLLLFVEANREQL